MQNVCVCESSTYTQAKNMRVQYQMEKRMIVVILIARVGTFPISETKIRDLW